jgi:hypothetical protein
MISLWAWYRRDFERRVGALKLSSQPIATRAASLVVFAVSLVTSGFVLTANAGTVTTFDVPGAILTQPSGINSGGAITGYYVDVSGVFRGFVRSATGTITTFDAPGAGTGESQGTVPLSINKDGVITGWYTDSSSAEHGFVR